MGKSDNIRKSSFIASIALLMIAYIPTFKWMIDRWMAPESYYGHGFLIPVISLYVFWQRRDLLKKCRIAGEMSGLIVIAAGLLVHIISALLKVYFMSGFSFVFVLYGIILFTYGKETVKALMFPIFFLFVMIPLPLVLVGSITVKLKLMVAQVATVLLNVIGFPSVRDGSIIRMPDSFVIVGAPCSGLRSLISLLTLGLLFSFAAKISYLKKGLLFVSSIPIALSTNVIRVMILGMVNDLYGEEVASGFIHDLSGYIMFGIAFGALYAISRVLEPAPVTELDSSPSLRSGSE